MNQLTSKNKYKYIYKGTKQAFLVVAVRLIWEISVNLGNQPHLDKLKIKKNRTKRVLKHAIQTIATRADQLVNAFNPSQSLTLYFF